MVVKPLRGSASLGVHFCRGIEDVLAHFEDITNTPDFFGTRIPAMALQEWALGTEYIVNTVSRAGKHALTDIWEYHKVSVGVHGNAYEYARLVRTPQSLIGELLAYTRAVLTALGIEWGAAHTEIMLTAQGPRLIETAARPMGGFFPRHILQECLGYDLFAADLDAYLDESRFKSLLNAPYAPQKAALLKLFITPQEMPLASAPVKELLPLLPSARDFEFTNSEGCDTLPRTVDLETSPGSVMLCHEDEAVVMRDYRSLRKLETRHFEMLFSRAPLAVRVPKMTLNGEPIEILSGESSDWTAMSGH